MVPQQWHDVGCYIAPDNDSNIEDVVADIRRRTQGANLLVAGGFNANLDKTEGTPRAEEIAAALAAVGLKDKRAHLLLRHKPWYREGLTLSMQRGEWVVRS